MDYIDLLNLKKEPFSISPDPNFFYHSKDYEECLQKLELSIRLRRGLNIVLGDVGTGKTTLSRALIQLFQGYEDFRFYLILDPSFHSEYEFLLALIKIFNISVPEEETCLAFKEAIRTYLLKEGLEKKRIIVLIIDESQKMDYPFLELLRDFLNFETNEYKLLQLVILGQMEFLEKIQGKKNFLDRVNIMYFLKPLNFDDTCDMIEFRLRKAGFFSHQPLFSKDGFRKIHFYSQGYPRKIVNICHHALLLMLIRKKRMVDGQLIEEVAESLMPERVFSKSGKVRPISRKLKVGVLISAVVLILILGLWGVWRYAGRVSSFELFSSGEKKQIPPAPAVTSSAAPTTKNISPPDVQADISSSSDLVSPPTKSRIRGDEEKNEAKNDPLPLPVPINNISDELSHSHPKSTDEVFTPADQSVSNASAKIKGYRMVVAGKGDNIYNMSRRLYGVGLTNEIFRSIKKANPNVLNIDLIEPGQNIYFPIFENSKDKGRSFSIYGVHIGYFPTMARAQERIQELSTIDSRIYIEKEDFSDNKKQYAVIIGPFGEITDAWDLLERLKKKDLNEARVVIIN